MIDLRSLRRVPHTASFALGEMASGGTPLRETALVNEEYPTEVNQWAVIYYYGCSAFPSRS
jgi:hypothetical protein